jgi:hypothetical protein
VEDSFSLFEVLPNFAVYVYYVYSINIAIYNSQRLISACATAAFFFSITLSTQILSSVVMLFPLRISSSLLTSIGVVSFPFPLLARLPIPLPTLVTPPAFATAAY